MAVSDLLNTTWVIDSVNANSAQVGAKSIVCSVKRSGSVIGEFNYMGCGYTVYMGNYTASANHVVCSKYSSGNVSSGDWIEVQVGDIISITGGTQTANEYILDWFNNHATEYSTTGSIYIGFASLDKCYVGNSEVQKIYLGDKLVYEKATPSGTLVNLYAGYNYMGAGAQGVKIKVNGIPTSENDFDYRLKSSDREYQYSVNTLTTGITVNSLYVWSELDSSYINADYVWNIGGTRGKTIPTGYTRAISIDFNESITPLTGQGAGTPQQFNGNIYFNIDFDD